MTVEKISDICKLNAVSEEHKELPVKGVYCCDLLSMVMGRAPAGCAWVTVMGNVNTVAVASLAEISMVVFADGVKPDDTTVLRARQNGINIYLSDKDVFTTALEIHKALEQ